MLHTEELERAARAWETLSREEHVTGTLTPTAVEERAGYSEGDSFSTGGVLSSGNSASTPCHTWEYSLSRHCRLTGR